MTSINDANAQQYLIEKGRDLPYVEGLINKQWKDDGIAYLVLTKKMPNGHFLVCLYVIDFLCTGLKKTEYFVGLTNEEYKHVLIGFRKTFGEIEKADVIFAHNLIYGAISYAEKLGFHPQANFKYTENLLDTDFIDEGVRDIEFGHLGKPLYIEYPTDNSDMIIKTLDRTIGSGNYACILRSDEEYDDVFDEGDDPTDE
jgi:hypothetical protein